MIRPKFLAATSLVALLIASLVLARPLLALADDPQGEHFQKTFPVSPGATLEVDNYKGTIHVTAAEGKEIAVDVLKKFEGGDSDRKWWMENLKIDFRNDPQKVVIKVDYPSCNFCFQFHDYTAEVDLEIRVPRQINLALDGYKPDVKISGVQGNVSIKSYKAPMLIEGTTGSIRVDTYKDSIRLRNVKITEGLEIRSYKADVEVSARDLGKIADLETEKGSIAVRVPGNAGLDLDYAGGRRSSFHSDFQLAVASGSTDSIHASINGGGTKLRLRTTKGTVSLEKAAGEL